MALNETDIDLITRVGPGTPMGEMLRRYWIPTMLSEELPDPDGAPKKLRLLGEDLVAFRDTSGRVGIMDVQCPHRLASLALGRRDRRQGNELDLDQLRTPRRDRQLGERRLRSDSDWGALEHCSVPDTSYLPRWIGIAWISRARR